MVQPTAIRSQSHYIDCIAYTWAGAKMYAHAIVWISYAAYACLRINFETIDSKLIAMVV
jgi:hypothetical protein